MLEKISKIQKSNDIIDHKDAPMLPLNLKDIEKYPTESSEVSQTEFFYFMTYKDYIPTLKKLITDVFNNDFFTNKEVNKPEPTLFKEFLQPKFKEISDELQNIVIDETDVKVLSLKLVIL